MSEKKEEKKKTGVEVPAPPKKQATLWGTGELKTVTNEMFFDHHDIPDDKRFSFKIKEMNHVDMQSHKFMVEDMTCAIQAARAKLGFTAKDVKAKNLTDAEYEELGAVTQTALTDDDRERMAAKKRALTIKYTDCVVMADGSEEPYTAEIHDRLQSMTLKNWLYNQIVDNSSFDGTGLDITAFL